MFRTKSNNKGSLTVEACVVFPVFLCFFLLLLFFIKLSCVNLALDLAVNETAKQIAASAYPITFINDMEDEILDKSSLKDIPDVMDELGRIPDYAGIGAPEDIYGEILTGNLRQPDLKGMLSKIAQDYKDGILGFIAGKVAGDYWNYKATIKYGIAKTVMDGFLQDSLIERQRLRFRLVEFPQGEAEYAARREQYGSMGFKTGNDPDITRDDVVVQVEYAFDIPIPFFGNRNIKLVHTAVEKAWLKGSNGTITSTQEGLDISKDVNPRIVYVTRTGEKYHLGTCRYLRKSKIPMTLEEAKEKYDPCKVCKPPDS